MAKTAGKARPAPKATPVTQPFWDGARKGKLMLQYDPATRRHQFWPRANSVRTGKRNLRWKQASGRGTLHSYTVTHVPTAGFEDRTPYLVGLVELEEGVRIISGLDGIAEDDVRIGMPVRVAWERLEDGSPYFLFIPDKRPREAEPGKRPSATE